MQPNWIKRLDTRITYVCIAVITLALVYFPSAGWYHYRHPARYAPAFTTEQEEREFKRKLRKHGLDAQISVIYRKGGKDYFIRNGQVCEFK